MEMIIAANVEFDNDVAVLPGARPVLRDLSRLASSNAGWRWRRHGMLLRNIFTTAGAVRRLLNEAEPFDGVFCFTSWWPQLASLLLTKWMTAGKFPPLGLLFVNYPRSGKHAGLQFQFVRFLVKLLGRRVSIFAETRYAQRSWEELLGRPVHYVVHPVGPAELAGDRRSKIEDRGGGGAAEDGGRREEKAETLKSEKLKEDHKVADGGGLIAEDGGQRSEIRGEEKRELVDKSAGGEGSGSMSPGGQSSCAGAKPELPVCEQGRDGETLEGKAECGNREKLKQNFEPLITQIYTDKEMEAGLRLGKPSELARNPEKTSLTRCASIPAEALRADNSPSAIRYQPSAAAKPLVFGFYGFARHEQGVDVLMRALEILKSRSEWESEFRIVWPQAFQMPDGSWLEPKMFEHLKDKVRFFEKALSPQEYQEQLSETDWLVLPYRVGSYQGRCSRISIEACVMGIPVIYTNGTDLKEVVANHGAGIGVPEEDAAALADAIGRANRESGQFAERAGARMAGASAFFSGKEFLRAILQGFQKN
jgi:glycosyltransferase involved in cell wall biosynthesis